MLCSNRGRVLSIAPVQVHAPRMHAALQYRTSEFRASQRRSISGTLPSSASFTSSTTINRLQSVSRHIVLRTPYFEIHHSTSYNLDMHTPLALRNSSSFVGWRSRERQKYALSKGGMWISISTAMSASKSNVVRDKTRRKVMRAIGSALLAEGYNGEGRMMEALDGNKRSLSSNDDSNMNQPATMSQWTGNGAVGIGVGKLTGSLRILVLRGAITATEQLIEHEWRQLFPKVEKRSMLVLQASSL